MGWYLKKINVEIKRHQDSKVYFQPTITQRLHAACRVDRTLTAFKFCVLWVTLTSSREMHPICSLSAGTDVWGGTGPQPPVVALPRTCPEMQWTAELHDFQIPNMGERTAVSQWGLYTPMPSLAARWTCCMHCPLFNSSLNVPSAKERLAELSPTCPLTYSR